MNGGQFNILPKNTDIQLQEESALPAVVFIQCKHGFVAIFSIGTYNYLEWCLFLCCLLPSVLFIT